MVKYMIVKPCISKVLCLVTSCCFSESLYYELSKHPRAVTCKGAAKVIKDCHDPSSPLYSDGTHAKRGDGIAKMAKALQDDESVAFAHYWVSDSSFCGNFVFEGADGEAVENRDYTGGKINKLLGEVHPYWGCHFLGGGKTFWGARTRL